MRPGGSREFGVNPPAGPARCGDCAPQLNAPEPDDWGQVECAALEGKVNQPRMAAGRGHCLWTWPVAGRGRASGQAYRTIRYAVRAEGARDRLRARDPSLHCRGIKDSRRMEVARASNAPPALLVQGTVVIGLDSTGTRGVLTVMSFDRTARKQLTRLIIP